MSTLKYLLTAPIANTAGRRLACAAALAAVAGVAANARGASTYAITQDTYIDSYVDGVTNRQSLNYGSAQTVKFVTSGVGASSQFPLSNSAVRGLAQLPAAFWADLGSANVASATVSYTVKNDMNYQVTDQAIRPVTLYPLASAFVAGTGGNNGSSFDGTAGTVGATWLSTNGTTNWTTPGGDYDAAYGVNGVEAGRGNNATFTWDIAALLNDPTTRAELRQNGLLIKLYNDTSAASPLDPAQPYPTPNQVFASLYSYDGAAASQRPSVTFVAVPEPAGLATWVIAASALCIWRRPSARAGS